MNYQIKYLYSTCLTSGGCAEITQHKSGICPAHRAVKCIECEVKFVPQSKGRYCATHRYLNKKRNNREQEIESTYSSPFISLLT